MSWFSIKSWMRSSPQARTARFTLPPTVIEIEPGFVAGMRFKRGGRHAGAVRRIAVRELRPGAVEPAPNRPNVSDGEELGQAIAGVRAVLGNVGQSAGLLIPDAAVHTAVLRFEGLPDDWREADALVRWRLRDLLTGEPEEVRISFQEISRGSEGVDLLIVAAKEAVMAEYERALQLKSGAPALLLPATMALLPLVPSNDEGGDVLIHIVGGRVTIAGLAAGKVRLWRHRLAPADLIADLTSEAKRAAASLTDQHNVKIGRFWLSERPPTNAPKLRKELAKALLVDVRPVPRPAEVAEGLPRQDEAIFEQFGAPACGLIANAA